MTLKIISAEKIEFEGKIDQVTLPGALGSFQILNNHAALMSSLVPGTMSYVTGETTTHREIKGGIVDVKDNVISVCLY
ncbi:MAG: F0F1 ATP synthase subunit epsilon [Muribaculaceae bacterium]|nr:F0F1 ATP synthase subunit epsilon [Muribaculaceae bacterium]MBQ2563551.1 F0F1 ATP synthase subunit epsilon [Muribaculaceae bacterium]MBQ5509200.1 F0F1 ATP synthase subunit epsilon [Muribaculaceae bacterium]MDY6292616.1 F0F1 ATP synthase subunit epsilon [Bacteroidales bacterium]MDY6412563.1 F0F1 ATP synthase subunit epsilon [Bacteroidales bacterium]